METRDTYEVKLEVFEGPLDLLVYLVQKSELSPREIPIALITDQYLAYLQEVGADNLSNAGEFLVMAARLMRLKARELLPQEEQDEIEEIEFDLDKQALIEQMLEYQKFKEVSKFLQHREVQAAKTFTRGRKERLPKEKGNLEELADDADIYDLLKAFTEATKAKRHSKKVHEVEIDDITIENQIKKMQHFLSLNPKFYLEQFCEMDTRPLFLVVSFMGLLELGKLGDVYSKQHYTAGPIWIYRRKNNPENVEGMMPTDMEFSELGPLDENLVDFLQTDILKRKDENALEKLMREIREEELVEHSAENEGPEDVQDEQASQEVQKGLEAGTIKMVSETVERDEASAATEEIEAPEIEVTDVAKDVEGHLESLENLENSNDLKEQNEEGDAL